MTLKDQLNQRKKLIASLSAKRYSKKPALNTIKSTKPLPAILEPIKTTKTFIKALRNKFNPIDTNAKLDSYRMSRLSKRVSKGS